MKKLEAKEDHRLEDINPEIYSYVHFFKNYTTTVARVHPPDELYMAVDFPYKTFSNLEFILNGFPDLRSDFWKEGKILKYVSKEEDEISMRYWKKVKDEYINDRRIVGVDGIIYDVKLFTGDIKNLLGKEKIKSFKDIWDQL